MNCSEVAENYRTKLESLPLREIAEVYLWEILVICDRNSQPTTVELLGTIPGCIYTCKDSVRERTHRLIDNVSWDGCGRPVLDIHTPDDLRITHSTRVTRLPLRQPVVS